MKRQFGANNCFVECCGNKPQKGRRSETAPHNNKTMHNNKTKTAALAAILCAGAAALANPPPNVGNVTLVQPHGTHRAQITYSTDGAGIATFQLMTNGVDIVHSEVVRTVSGAVNKFLPAGRHSFTWDARRDFPEQILESLSVKITLWSPDNPPQYCAVNLVAQNGRYPVMWYGKEAEVPFGANHGWWKKDWLLLRKIPSTEGVFVTQGSPVTEAGRNSGREALHSVRLTKPFYAGVFPVTQRQYSLVMGSNPSWFNNPAFNEERPVETVRYDVIRGTIAQGANWPDTGYFVAPDSFMGRLRELTGGILEFDLPTEAQWEHACRAGTSGAWNNGTSTTGTGSSANNPDPNLGLLGRYQRNGGQTHNGEAWVDPPRDCSPEHGTATVGSYLPNAWGLYDMHGNVREFCLNYSNGNINGDSSPDPALAGDDPAGVGPGNGSQRAIRTGHWGEPSAAQRSARRGQQSVTSGANTVGFRVFARAEADVANVAQ